MEIKINHLGGLGFSAETRGHRLICDQPKSNGGGDLGMTPPELLVAALGTCAGFYAVEYLRARSLSTNNLAVNVSAEKAVQPARLGSFLIEVTAPNLDDRHLAGLERAVRSCLIHNTLMHAPKVDLAVRSLPLATLNV